VFRNLPPYLQERIAGALNEKVLDAPAFNSRDTEAGVDVPLRDLPEGVQRRFRDAIRGYDSPAAQSQDLTVRFANLGSAVLAAVASGGEPLFDGNALFSHFTGYGMGGMDFSPDTLLRGLDHEWFTSPRFPQKRIPEHWKPLLEYAKSRVWENAPLEARPYSPMPEAVQRRSALLDVLANEGGAEIVADYHSARPSGINSAKFDELRRSLPDRITSEVKEKVVGEVLNGVASWYDASWKASVASPGVYLVRNNRWYRDDLLEVPNKLLDRWIAHRHSRMTVEDVRPFKPGTRIYTTGRDGRSRAEVVRATAPVPDGAAAPPKQRRAVYLTAHRMTPEQLQGHLDWQAEVVAALTPAQVAHGLRSAVPEEGRGIPRPARGDAPDAAMAEVVRLTTGNRPLFSFDADEIVRRRPLLEFYALLDPAARAALIAGTLDPSRLTDPQREKATALLPSLNGTGGTLGLDARRSRLVLRPATPDAGTRAPGGQP